MTSRTLDQGNDGIFLILGNAGFISSAVPLGFCRFGVYGVGFGAKAAPETPCPARLNIKKARN